MSVIAESNPGERTELNFQPTGWMRWARDVADHLASGDETKRCDGWWMLASLASHLSDLAGEDPGRLAEDQAALQIEILRQRQLRRPDVRELLLRRAERKGVSR